jgi:hypothetical protein
MRVRIPVSLILDCHQAKSSPSLPGSSILTTNIKASSRVLNPIPHYYTLRKSVSQSTTIFKKIESAETKTKPIDPIDMLSPSKIKTDIARRYTNTECYGSLIVNAPVLSRNPVLLMESNKSIKRETFPSGSSQEYRPWFYLHNLKWENPRDEVRSKAILVIVSMN